MTARPNIVIDSKGRHVYQRLMSEEDAQSMKNTDRHRLDERKTVAKMMPRPITGPESYSMYGMIFNDDQSESDTMGVKIKIGKLSTEWTVVVTVNGVVVADGDTFSMDAGEMFPIKVTMTRTETDIVDGELCFAVIQMYPQTSADIIDYQDAFKVAMIPQFVLFNDIDLNMEQLIEDEVIFPDDADYVTEDVINEFIKHRTDEVIDWLIRRLNNVIIPDYEHVRRFIINRVKKDCYQRFIDYSISGGGEFMTNINQLKDEAMEILKNIQADGDVDW